MHQVPLFKNLIIASMVGITTLLAGCGGGGGVGGDNNTVAPLSVTPNAGAGNVGDVLNFVVSGGKQPYSILSSNTAIATVSGVSTSAGLSTFSARLAQEGQTILVLADSTGQSTPIDITSAQNGLAIAPTTGAGNVGNTLAFYVGGGTPPYTVVSNNASVAQPSLTGNLLTVLLATSGSTTLVVRDAGGATSLIHISAAPPGNLAISPGTGSGNPGDTLSFVVGGGASPYTVVSNNSLIASASIVGSVVSSSLLTIGQTNLVLRDSAGATALIPVSVTPTSPLALSPSTATIPLGHLFRMRVTGGLPPYLVFSSNTSIGAVSPVDASGSFTVNALSSGSVVIVAQDSTATTRSVTLEVTQLGSTNLAVLPNSVSWESEACAPVFNDLVIYGGTPPYRAQSTSPLIAVVTPPGLDPATGNYVLTVSKPCGTDMEQEATGTSTIVITDKFGTTTTATFSFEN